MTYQVEGRMQKVGGARKSLAMSLAMSNPGSRLTHFQTRNSIASASLAHKEMRQLGTDSLVRMEAALSNEVGLTVLETLVFFSEYFKVICSCYGEMFTKLHTWFWLCVLCVCMKDSA